MFFIDLDNFKQSLWTINKKLTPDFSKAQFSILDDLVKTLDWKKYNPRLIRAYAYSGLYTDALLGKVKTHLKKNKKLSELEKAEILGKLKENKKLQREVFGDINRCHFIELKKRPLQYSFKERKAFQKGVDVQLAVDLVSHAYQDNFDVAVVCSGDLDLLESIKIVKTLGKKVIIVSYFCEDNTSKLAKDMLTECDYLYNLKDLDNKKASKICYKIK